MEKKNGISMRTGNKGLTVKVNLWPPRWQEQTKADEARLLIAGMVTHADDGRKKMFNDAGELLTTLGKWNVERFKDLRKQHKA